ncbi:MAG: DedA family protein [Candidatus Gracilibacteria bacterium]|nr:DedA family protein [Candidatus Gracilibacteria bacterium]MDD2908775.1 DedA family protein [Candidatus Gracilibacteria bacterium]
MDFFNNLAVNAHDLILQMPYFWIFILMTIESSFIPFPSEVIMIPAGFFASTGKINFFLGFLAGLFGSLAGAMINYAIGYYGGSKLITKLIGESNNNLCLNYFKKHGDNTTLIGRFIPGIRQIISLPAGVFKMNFKKFVIYTSIGAGLWVLILMIFGYFVGENKELFIQYKYYFTIGSIVLVSVLIYLKIIILKYLQKDTKNIG